MNQAQKINCTEYKAAMIVVSQVNSLQQELGLQGRQTGMRGSRGLGFDTTARNVVLSIYRIFKDLRRNA